MAEPILLGVEIQTAKASRDYKKFTDDVKRGSADAAKSITTTASAAEASAKRTTTATAALAGSAQTMGQKFAGAGSAISSANAALQLMGRQGPPALQTLASGAAAVAVSGFGPMTLAITAAVTVLSLLTSTSDEATTALERQETQLAALTARSISARQELEALRLGIPLSEFQIDQEVDTARIRFDAARRNASDAAAELARVRKLVPPRPFFDGPLEKAQDLAKATAGELSDRETELRILESIQRNKRRSEEQRRQDEADRKAEREARAQQEAQGREREAAQRRREDRIRAREDADIAARVAEQRRTQSLGFRLEGLRTGADPAILEIQAEIARRQALDFPDSGRRENENRKVIEALQERITLTKELRVETERIAEAEAQDRFFRGFGERSAQSITSALSSAVATGEFDGFADALGSIVATTIADVAVNALLRKPLESAIGDTTAALGSNIGSLFGLLGDATTPDTGGTAATTSNPGKRQVLIADFTGQADTIAAAISRQGAQAIVQQGVAV